MKTIIVGGGIGGLITALYLTKRGEQVAIIEKEEMLGGRLAFIQKDGFTIDKGPTIVLLPEMIRSILEEVGVDPNSLEMVRIDPLYSLTYSDGTTFMKWSNKEKQLAEINRVFPGEEQSFLSYLDTMNKRFTLGKSVFLDRQFIKKRDFFSFPSLVALMKLKAYQSVEKQTAQFFKDQRLQEAFSLQTLYIGGAPSTSPALYSLVSFSEHYHGIWYVKGGYGSLIPILEKELKMRGVEIYLNTTINRIEEKDNRVSAVHSEDQCFEADRFVMNGEIPLVKAMLPEKQPKRPAYISSSSCLLLYFGLNKTYEEANVHQFYMSEDFKKNMKEIFADKRLPSNPSLYAFHPSKIDDTLAPSGKAVLYVLIPVPSGSEIDWKDVDAFIDSCIETLESWHFPNLREHMEWMEVRTPQDAEEDGLFQGGSFGLAPVLKQSGVFRPQIKPFGRDNLYAVGASVHPGGGIPIVMQGAKLLSDYLANETEPAIRKEKSV
ncbi:phytoene desaturase family protein [Alkalicoccobacillus plakortidis]|uniref:Phytoene desaturase family protein n=1 Tax=Alkalicoccobacillus plakortidis TaxID=444060 RepID=A0ABT0XE62_9BACI|nr:phytoene desaturase family protein [Alkalicoccobacillus plakortidis]MCM2674193.1 phytoene desaturase family protein [Alkalicoccobacillus plakortidis]